MMRSAISAHHYISQDVLDEEFKTIFGKLWLFVGLKQFLRQDRQYLTRKIAGVPIVVTRTADGEIVAFQNQCPHRQMPLFMDDFGKKSLFCPYHGWAFNEQGGLRRIPNPEIYKFPEAECNLVGLRPLACKVVGEFVFVNLSSDPMPIERQYSTHLLNSFEEASSYLGDMIGYSKFYGGYNWKLNFENVKDWNHVAFLHSKSFAPLLEQGRVGSPEEPVVNDLWNEAEGDIPMSLAELSYDTSSPMIRKTPWYDGLLDRYRGEDRYYNWFLYPNINFTSIHGELFQIQQFNPVAPGVTEYHLWVMAARSKTRNLNVAPLISFLLKMEKATIEEDRVYLENLQQNLHINSPTAIHGHYELHIKRMNDWYAKALASGEV
jgi:phenylpropionate dioxygenase-like ring-hydroxylating dioxygenase large terminal subunit